MMSRKSVLPEYPDRPYVLDLFCGAGGAAMGYYMAGFNIVGVDISPQPRFPFRFFQADAMTFPLDGFAAVHASPPCQHYSITNQIHKKSHPQLIEPIRERLQENAVPYIIENVIGAPLLSPITLCGNMFGLRVYRHRQFECSFAIPQPYHPAHIHKAVQTGRKPSENEFHSVAGHFPDLLGAKAAMNITWMKTAELAQAIPPNYTKYVADYLLLHLVKGL
jgi:DNA (cytosine-5)-methyltransferase 1